MRPCYLPRVMTGIKTFARRLCGIMLILSVFLGAMASAAGSEHAFHCDPSATAQAADHHAAPAADGTEPSVHTHAHSHDADSADPESSGDNRPCGVHACPFVMAMEPVRTPGERAWTPAFVGPDPLLPEGRPPRALLRPPAA